MVVITWEGECYWCLVRRGRRYCQTFYNAHSSPHNTYPVQIVNSTVIDRTLHKSHGQFWYAHGSQYCFCLLKSLCIYGLVHTGYCFCSVSVPRSNNTLVTAHTPSVQIWFLILCCNKRNQKSWEKSLIL